MQSLVQSLTRLIVTGNAALCGPLPGSWTTSKVAAASTLLTQDCLQTTGLLSIKAAVTPATWPDGMGWTAGTDPCGGAWVAVTCTGAKVTALDLSFYGMVGTLPAYLSLTAGLTSLTFSGNRWAKCMGSEVSMAGCVWVWCESIYFNF